MKKGFVYKEPLFYVKARDLLFGIRREEEIKPILNQYFTNLKKNTNKYAVIDYTSDNFHIEIKSMNYSFENWNNKFEYAMIGHNKRRYALGETDIKETLFLWFFNCGTIKVISGTYMKNKEFHKDDWDFYISNGGRCDRGSKEYKPYCFVKKDKLINLCNCF